MTASWHEDGNNLKRTHKKEMDVRIFLGRESKIRKCIFCVRHQKAELGFKIFIISHIIPCQNELFTVNGCSTVSFQIHHGFPKRKPFK